MIDRIPPVIQAKLDAMAARRPANQLQGKRNWRNGNTGQNIIEDRLRQLGVQMVETISVGWNVRFKPGTRQPVSAYPLKRVSGDIRGLIHGGRSVLAEVKRSDDRLIFSELYDHQVTSLNTHLAAGGLSLLGFVWQFDGGGCSVMVWPVAGFAPGKSISVPQAKMLNLKAIRP